MTEDEKQAELEKNKKIIDATIDFLLLHYTGVVVYDDVDSDKKHFTSQQAQAEKHFNKNNLTSLERQLRELIKRLQYQPKPNLDFKSYVKERTGHDLDIFAEHRKSFDDVLAKGRIDTEKECNDVCIMLSYLGIEEKEMQEIYEPMLIEFYERQMAIIEASPELKKKYDEHHEIIEEDGEQIEIFYSGGKPSHHNRRVVVAPNGKFNFSITETVDDYDSSTSIDLMVENYGCGLYSVEGIHPEINAFWKDNHTIVIETKGCEAERMHKKIEINGHLIHVEHINDNINSIK